MKDCTLENKPNAFDAARMFELLPPETKGAVKPNNINAPNAIINAEVPVRVGTNAFIDLEPKDCTLTSSIVEFCKYSVSQRPQKKFRLHVIGLVHLPVSDVYNSCAFTAKIVKFCRMMVSLGHEVFLYGAEDSNAPYTKFFQTHTLQEIRDEYGDADKKDGKEFPLGYNWHKSTFREDWGRVPPSQLSQKFVRIVAAVINWHKQKDDILVVTMGLAQQFIINHVGLYLTVETGIGYCGVTAPFRCYESHFILNYLQGKQEHSRGDTGDGRWYHRVVPNYFEDDQFALQVKKKDYFLYIGRLIHRKGLALAIQACTLTGATLLIAGQGVKEYNSETGLLRFENQTFNLPPNVKYIGFADVERRKELMMNAKGGFVMSLYLEPFAGVSAELQLCGTPVICSDFGAMCETVEHGKTGFRCNTVNDIVSAMGLVHKLDPHYIRARAYRLYSMSNVRHMYEKFFYDLYDVYLSTLPANDPEKKRGFYEVHEQNLQRTKSSLILEDTNDIVSSKPGTQELTAVAPEILGK